MMPDRAGRTETPVEAVLLVRDHAGECPAEWAATTAVSSRLAMSPEMPPR